MEHVVDSNGCRIHYAIEGPAAAPALIFCNSIGTTRELWDAQVPVLSPRWRVITYDARGHGRSGVPAGDYGLEQLGRDVLAILDAEGVASAHVCGLSLGGLTAMWLGVNAAERVSSLVLANTAARVGSVESWTERIAIVRAAGMAAVAERAIPLWFSADFRERAADTVQRFRSMLESCAPEGYAGCCAALRDADLRAAIAAIRCPTLIVAGSEDAATTPEAAEAMRATIPGAQLVTLRAAHLSNVERAADFTAALVRHLG
jgi:3-oxoadipate enol-lactonase